MPKWSVRVASKQRDEASLLKVSVVGERFADPALLHHKEAGAVGQTPGLIGTLGVALQGGIEETGTSRDSIHARIGLHSASQRRHQLAAMSTSARKPVQHFDEHKLSGDRGSTCEFLGELRS